MEPERAWGSRPPISATLARFMEKLVDIKVLLEYIIQGIEYPLYDPMEVGFRHSSLNDTEKLKRFSRACSFTHQDLLTLQKMLDELENEPERSRDPS